MQHDDTMSVGGHTNATTNAMCKVLPATELAADSKFVQRLFQKVKRALSARGAYGQVDISETFKRLDRALTREGLDRRFSGNGNNGTMMMSSTSSSLATVAMGRNSGGGHSTASVASSAAVSAYAARHNNFANRPSTPTGGTNNNNGNHSTYGGGALTDPDNAFAGSADCNNFIRYIHDGLSMEGITVKEVEVLFVLMDTDEDGLVDMADAFLAMRKLFHCTAQQFHDVLKKIRSRKPLLVIGPSNASGGNPHAACANPFRKRSGAMPSRPPTREMVFNYLLMGSGINGPFNLTESEAYLFLDYCSVQEKDVGGVNSMGRADSEHQHHEGDGRRSRSPSLGKSLGELDLPYIESVLYSDSLPDDVAFPLVMSKFVEAATDPTKGELTGTSGILRALRQCTLIPHPAFVVTNGSNSNKGGRGAAGVPTTPNNKWIGSTTNNAHLNSTIRPHDRSDVGMFGESPEVRQKAGYRQNGRSGANDDDEGDDDDEQQFTYTRVGGVPVTSTTGTITFTNKNGTTNSAIIPTNNSAGGRVKKGSVQDLMLQCVDADNFRRFCHIFQAGLPVGECDLLFGYLCDPSLGLLAVETLVQQFQDRIDVWTAVDMGLTISTIRGRTNLLQLHSLLASQFGCYDEIPLENVTAALRKCGVSPIIVSDIEIEHVYRETRTAAALVLLLRGPIPQPREQIIAKLFAKLDDDDDGVISADLMLRALDPSQAPNLKHATAMQQDMLTFLLSMGGSSGGGGASNTTDYSVPRYHADEDDDEMGNHNHANNNNNNQSGFTSNGRNSPAPKGATPQPMNGDGYGGGGANYRGGQLDSSTRLTYTEFSYFWGCISLQFDCDNNFSMFVWRTYRMQDNKKRGYAVVVQERRAVPLQRLVANGATGNAIVYGGNAANSNASMNGGYSASRMRGTSPSVGGGGGNGGGAYSAAYRSSVGSTASHFGGNNVYRGGGMQQHSEVRRR